MALLASPRSFDGFISYRQWSDTHVAEKLYLRLRNEGFGVFWDKECATDLQERAFYLHM